MRVAFLKVQQSEATGEYAVFKGASKDKPWADPPQRRHGARVLFSAHNPERQMRTHFTASTVALSRSTVPASSEEGQVEIQLAAWGRSSTLTAPDPPAPPRVSSSPLLDDDRQPIGSVDNRVEYERENGLTEWYLNGPAGLEQGFTLSERPPGSGDIVFDVSIEGNGITLELGQGKVEFHTAPEVVIGEYRELYAEDATGKLLPSTMSLVAGRVRIAVNDAGAQYPLTIDPTVWLVEAKLLAKVPTSNPADAAATDAFGTSVALSGDGDTAIIGSPNDDDQGGDSGAAYVFVRTGTSWAPQAKLLARLPGGALDGAASDRFGTSVAISGDTVLVSSTFDDDQAADSGAAYVFVRTGTSWSAQGKLVARLSNGNLDGAAFDNFGISVALWGDTAVVASRYDDDQAPESGSAYVFVRSAAVWSPQAKLIARLPGGTLEGAKDDFFGSSLALWGDTLVVGSRADDDQGENSGSAYVFLRVGTSWQPQAKLTARLPGGAANGSMLDAFGASAALSGDTLVIGSPDDDDQGTDSGSAYVFVRSGSTWAVESKLVAALPGGTADGASGDRFGAAVAVSSDAIVIGSSENDDQGADSGSAYVFVRAAAGWQVDAKLASELPGGTSDGAAGDRFGAAVAVSSDAIVIGSSQDDGSAADSGSAYVLVRSGSAWSTQAKLTARLPDGSPDGASFDNFGAAVAASGDTVVVGARYDNDSASDSGSAYVFVRSGTAWSLETKLAARLPGETPDGAGNDRFGSAVAISGNTIAIGTPQDDDQGTDSGSVYVFVRSGTSWSSQAKLVARLPGESPDGAASDLFGASVVLGDNLIAIGSPQDDDQGAESGSVYVFVRSGTSWSSQAKLLAQLPGESPDGAASDAFGFSVAASAEAVLVGSPYDDDQGTDSGSAYVFVRSGSIWSSEAKLAARLPGEAADGSLNDRFGFSVALSGDTAVVGSPLDDDVTADLGSAYVFTRSGSVWSTQAKLSARLPGEAPDSTTSDEFGYSVALAADAAVVGSRSNDDQGAEAGCAYVFTRSGSTWTSQAKLLARRPGEALAGAAFDRFGFTVALSADTAIVGAFDDDTQADGAGAAYVYRFWEQVPGEACWNDDQCSSGSCSSGICCDLPCAGLCQDCVEWLTGQPDGTCANVLPGTRCGDDPLACASSETYALAPTCSSSGACEAHSADCSGYACVEGPTVDACALTCAGHDDCAAAYYCSGASCVPDKVGGEPCSDPNGTECTSAQCVSGECRGDQGEVCGGVTGISCTSGTYCVDGVCCEQECSGVCETCSLGGSAGMCLPVPDGELPAHGSCAAPGHAACGAGFCDGSDVTQCTFGVGTPCGQTDCSDNEISGDVCNSEGDCANATTPMACEGNLTCADGQNCRSSCSSHAHCVAGTYCDFTAGECRGIVANGDPCGDDSQCDSDQCVDGICCNTACDSQCEACDVEGQEGTCSAVEGAPHGDRPACDAGNHASCGATCDGKAKGCVYPAQGTACEDALCNADSVLTPARTCDGAGECIEVDTETCFPFGCDADESSCRSSCSDSDDCAAGAVCDAAEEECVILDSVCESTSTVRYADGSRQSCEPYVCASGACLDSCDENSECLDGFSCNGDECAADEPNGGGEGDGDPAGCGCSTIGGDGPVRSGAWPLLALGGLALLRRRRNLLYIPAGRLR